MQAGLVDADTFLAGYGAAQAIPGPLFTFAAYLGTAMSTAPTRWLDGLWCLLGIFLPAWLLVGGALPFWHRLRTRRWAQAALAGANAAVVGVLLAALYHPVFTESVHGPRDVGVAVEERRDLRRPAVRQQQPRRGGQHGVHAGGPDLVQQVQGAVARRRGLGEGLDRVERVGDPDADPRLADRRLHHDDADWFRYSRTKPSMSPSSTRWTSPTSCSVRWSFTIV